MKKGFKLSIASIMAVSALAPAAVFADTTPATKAANGFYTADSFTTPQQFRDLSLTAKQELLKKADLVLVVSGEVFLGKDAIGKTDAQLEDIKMTEAEFEAEYGELTNSGYDKDVVVDLKVESVMAINANTVEVTFPALKDAVTDATVEVKDNNGNVIATKATDIVKGATSAQFDFEKAFPGNYEFTGVWTVNGVAFDFADAQKLEDIVAAATVAPGDVLNQVKLLNALNNAGITGVDEDALADYAPAIVDADPQSLADVQAAIDEVNENAAEISDEEAAIEAVEKATNQVQLLKALQDNFERVNADWIVNYTEGAAGAADDSIAGFDVDPDPEVANETVVNNHATEGLVALDIDNIQDTIDNVNARVIAETDAAAEKSADQAKVTALIEKWVEADTGTATDKADQIADSKEKEAAFKVAEATTQNSLYNALVAYANASPDGTLKASELNANLKAQYSAALATHTKAQLILDIRAGSPDIKGDIVTEADAAALGAALTAIEDLTATSTTANLKAALQKLADVTSHTADKFEMSKVNDQLLAEYLEALEDFDAGVTTTASGVDTIISGVNGAVKVEANVATVANASSTTLQVRDALTELAAVQELDSNEASFNQVALDYLNLSSQAKTEVAQFVIDNNDELTDPLTEALIVANEASPTYANAVIEAAIADHEAKLQDFNDIGDLDSAEIAATKAALDAFENAKYEALPAAKKFEVAEEINKLTKVVGTTVTPLNFQTDDAVTTIAEANAIIEAAITRVAE